MITDGNATVFVNNMDAGLRFYSEVLGMRIATHYGDHWATVEAGGFTIGLHPKREQDPQPGTKGSISIGLLVESLEGMTERLREGGAKEIGERIDGSGGSFVNFQDPDGNALYLWEMAKD